jgi:hypothetical protein
VILRSVDAVLTRQALITGRVEDGLSGRPPLQPPVVGLYRQDAAGRLGPAFPLSARVLADGQFVFSGDPARAFPDLADDEVLDLRLVVRCTGYQEQAIAISISPDLLAIVTDTRFIGGQLVTIERFNAPLIEQVVQVSPLPVHLAGRVVEAEDPTAPIAGAQVRLIDVDGVRLVGRLHVDQTDSPVARQEETQGAEIELIGSLAAGAMRLPQGTPAALTTGDVLRIRTTPGQTEYVTIAADDAPIFREPGLLFAHPRATTRVHQVTLEDAAGEPADNRTTTGRAARGQSVVELTNVTGLAAGQVLGIGAGATREFQRIAGAAPFGPVTTDDNGFFTLRDLPVRAEIGVHVTHPDFTTQDPTTIALDYRQAVNAVNDQTFALTA